MTTDIRTGMTILEPHESWHLLKSVALGRLGVSVAGHPDIFPVNFVVDQGTVLFRTAEGAKLAAAVLGRSVAFEADGLDTARGEAWSVVVKGRAVEVQTLVDLFEATGLPLFPWLDAPMPRFVRIVPDAVTGRTFRVGGKGE